MSTDDKKEVKTEEVKTEEVKTEEVKTEDVKVEEVVKKEKKEMNVKETIIDHLDSLKKNEDIKKEVSTLMLQITGDESHMDKVEALFNRIIEDKKVNISDIGDIVLLLEELYIIYNKSKLRVNSNVLSETLKSVISLLLSYRLEKSDKLTDEEKNELISSLEKIIDLCVELLDFKDKNKTLKSLFSFFICA
jgi:superfamily II DNA helicase RecQ